MSGLSPSAPGWRVNLRDPKRWQAQVKRTLFWLAGGYAAFYALGMIVPGGFTYVVSTSIPRGLYWHDTRPFSFDRGQYIRIKFTPNQPWIAERYARPVDYLEHAKTIGGLPGDLIVADSAQNYFICSPEAENVDVQIPVSSALQREGMQCRNAGRPQAVDSKNRPMTGWLPANTEYRLQPGEIWTWGRHERSMDSRYYGPWPVSKVVAKLTPLVQLD